MKLGLGFVVMVAGVVLAGATHNVLFGIVGLVAMYVGWVASSHTDRTAPSKKVAPPDRSVR